MVLVETCVKSSCWEVLYKKRFLFLPGVYVIEIGWTVLDKRVILKRAFIFPKVVLWEIKSSSQKSRCLSVRNKVITSFLPRIFSQSIEYPDYLSVSSLKIRKKAIIFPGSKQKGKRSISVSQAKRYIFSRIPNFETVLPFSTE